MSQANYERLVGDLKTVIVDAEDLMKAAASATGEKAVELREKAAVALRRAREGVLDLQDTAIQQGKRVARATDDFVHDHPWKAVGIAAGVGFLIGLLVNRK